MDLDRAYLLRMVPNGSSRSVHLRRSVGIRSVGYFVPSLNHLGRFVSVAEAFEYN